MKKRWRVCFITICELKWQILSLSVKMSWYLCLGTRYGYQLAGNGRWVSMAVKKPKKKGGEGKKAKKAQRQYNDDGEGDESDKAEEEVRESVASQWDYWADYSSS